MPEPVHRTHPLATNVAGKHRAEPIPPETHGLVANVDATLEQEVLDVTQRQRETDIHQYDQVDYLGRRIETTERAW